MPPQHVHDFLTHDVYFDQFLFFVLDIFKMLYIFLEKNNIYTHTYKMCIWLVGVEKERMGGMERVTWKLKLPYIKQIANGNLLYGSGNSN